MDRPPKLRPEVWLVARLCFRSPWYAEGAGEFVRPALGELKNAPTGDEGASNRENGFFSAGYPWCLASTAGTGGTGDGMVPPVPFRAFFIDANEPLRVCRNPGVEPMDVPVVMIDDEEPLLNFPNRGLSGLSASYPYPLPLAGTPTE
jgi:hypothetical protein